MAFRLFKNGSEGATCYDAEPNCSSSYQLRHKGQTQPQGPVRFHTIKQKRYITSLSVCEPYKSEKAAASVI